MSNLTSDLRGLILSAWRTIGTAAVGVESGVSGSQIRSSNLMTGPFDRGFRQTIRGQPKVADADAVIRRFNDNDSYGLS